MDVAFLCGTVGVTRPVRIRNVAEPMPDCQCENGFKCMTILTFLLVRANTAARTNLLLVVFGHRLRMKS